MQPSPYTPGGVAKIVPGRAQQIADLVEHLSVLVDLRRFIDRIRVDHGPRGYGKTSLLREYQRRAEERGLFTVWVTAGESNGLVAQLAEEIASKSSSWASSTRKLVAKHVERLTLQVGVPGVATAEATLAASSPGKVPAPRTESRALEELVTTVARAKSHAGLVIFIDEVQAADPAGIRTLAYAWQHLQAEGAGVPAAVFAAGLPNAPEEIGAAVTFSERFAYRPLRALDRNAEEQALVIAAEHWGVRWDQAALDRALEFAQGYPYAIQIIGDTTWKAAGRPDPGAVITLADVEAGESAAVEELEGMYQARWGNSTPAERDFMTAMAELGAEARPVRRADLAEKLGKDPIALSVPRARLIEKGFIQQAGYGYLEFTIPGFAAFILYTD